VEQQNPTKIANSLRRALCDLILDPEVQLPACCFVPANGHYARRELYRSEQHGFSVIAMTWGPGQGTPIHDHNGMWCVEGLWRGSLEITPFELTNQRRGLYRFEPRGTMTVGRGSTGSLIPPHEYHTIWNPSSEVTAVSVHVYREPMDRCSVFRPIRNGWYIRDERQLSLDAVV
jgi:predicted metal-dependent enzyme (double-stranded beta helix superfamily)